MVWIFRRSKKNTKNVDTAEKHTAFGPCLLLQLFSALAACLVYNRTEHSWGNSYLLIILKITTIRNS